MAQRTIEAVRDPDLHGARVPFDSLPVIDIGPLQTRAARRTSTVAKELGRAARDVGFFYVTNHGVPQGLIDEMSEMSRRFFALPMDAKLKLRLTPEKRIGYMAVGRQFTDDEAEGDLVEGMEHGLEIRPTDPDADFPFYGPNRWPDGLPGYKDAMLAYADAMIPLGRRILGALAMSLGMNEDCFEAATEKPIMLLSPRHYPPQAGHITRHRLGVGAHADYGCITMLAQDEVGGLQILNSAGRWIEAAPISGTFVCNLGELLERWTNGIFVATQHRVINDSGRARYSCPFFLNPGRHAEVAVLDACCGPDNPPRYSPVNTGEHYLRRMRFYD